MARKPSGVYFCIQSGASRSGLIDKEARFLDLKELHFLKGYWISNPNQRLGRDELRRRLFYSQGSYKELPFWSLEIKTTLMNIGSCLAPSSCFPYKAEVSSWFSCTSLESLLVSMFASRAEFTGKVVRCLSLGN